VYCQYCGSEISSDTAVCSSCDRFSQPITRADISDICYKTKTAITCCLSAIGICLSLYFLVKVAGNLNGYIQAPNPPGRDDIIAFRNFVSADPAKLGWRFGLMNKQHYLNMLSQNIPLLLVTSCISYFLTRSAGRMLLKSGNSSTRPCIDSKCS